MSTNWGYVCRSHDPEIVSEHWFNRGTRLLETVFMKVRNGQWPNDPEYTYWDEPVPVNGITGPIHWLRQHPKCDVALRNEYGDTRELPAPHRLLRLDKIRSPQQGFNDHQEWVTIWPGEDWRIAHCSCGAWAQIEAGAGHRWIVCHRTAPHLTPGELAEEYDGIEVP